MNSVRQYDVIVVGTRVAGAPTAMLLARKGYRVLALDRAAFPSDTMSTHLIQPTGMAALRRWGLSDRLIATGCPPVGDYRQVLGPLTFLAAPRRPDGAPPPYGPRRTVLDALLVDAAAEAGVEIRQGCSVTELIVEDGVVRGVRGDGFEERCQVVVGADGVNSQVARAVGAPKYQEVSAKNAIYYGHWSGLWTNNEFQLFQQGDRAVGTVPTNDGLTCVFAAWPVEQFEENKRDLLGSYHKAFQIEPEFADQLAAATLETRLVGTRAHGFYRKPYGSGWALVGDAGYHKDPCTAQGISDAFRDAEALADALDEALSDRLPYVEALAAYQRDRDEQTLPMYELTCDFASFDPPPEELEQLMVAISGSQRATEDFISVQAGTMPIPEFFAPDNLAKYFG